MSERQPKRFDQIRRIFKKQPPLQFPTEEFEGHMYVGTVRPEDDAFVDFPQCPYYNKELHDKEEVSMDPRHYYLGEAEIPALDAPNLSADGQYVKDDNREPAAIQVDNKEFQKKRIAIPHIISSQETMRLKTEDGEMDPWKFRKKAGEIKTQIEKVYVGNTGEVVDPIITAIIAGGHVLIMGIPGTGKTMLVRTIADIMDLTFRRIQFTPDLMPTDITGTNIFDKETGKFEFVKGPIFGNIILADEINRATPKTQAALLEAMQEKTVTPFGEQYTLEDPFFVLATQNPLEIEGTYPLPEAQLDRFFFEVLVPPTPSVEDLAEIFRRTTTETQPKLEKVTNGPEIIQMRTLARMVPIASPLEDYVSRFIHATWPESPHATPKVQKYVRYGSSARGGQAIILASKIETLKQENDSAPFNVSFDTIRKVALLALRHRLILNFEAEAGGTTTDEVINDLCTNVPEHTDDFR